MLTIPAHDARAIAICAAIHSGDVGALQRMLHEDPAMAKARIVDDRGVARSLLHVAADWPGHFPQGARTVAALVAAGADVHASVNHPTAHSSRETPLHWAASSDDVAVLDALLDGGADIEAPGAIFTGGAPMSDAVIFAQWRAARRLLERGATTTLWQAAALGLLERVRELRSATPPPAVEQLTNALWHACRGGQRAVVEYLVSQGADINSIGHDHKTPLDVARETGNDSLAAWLEAHGAKPATPGP